MKNILITGSEGFIGSYLKEYLDKTKYNIFCIDKKKSPYENVVFLSKKYLINNNIDAVIHLAAQTSVWNKNHRMIIDDNIIGFMNIVNICCETSTKLIYASSSCSNNITSLYGITKQFDDEFAKIYGGEYCIGLRFHNVYGNNSRKDTLCGICLNNDEVTLYNNGLNYRHFTYIDDVCKAIEKSLNNIPKGIYNVCNNELTSIHAFCNEISKYKKLNIKLIDDIREYDKAFQNVDDKIPNMLENYTSYIDGIKFIFNKS